MVDTGSRCSKVAIRAEGASIPGGKGRPTHISFEIRPEGDETTPRRDLTHGHLPRD
jgi:hypothetical protein